MNFISEDFHLHYLASYTLYIKNDFHTDYLFVIGNESEVLVFLKYDSLQPCVEAVRILSLPFSKVIIEVTQQNLIWVPSDVYNESEKHLYSAYFLNEDVDKIIAKDVAFLNAVALYQFDPLMTSHWLKLFPEAQLLPSFEVLLNQFNGYDFTDAEELLAINLFENQTEIVLFVHGEFKLFNTFEVSNEDDLSFHVLSIMKNFGLGGKFSQIMLSGAGEESSFAIRLKNYTDKLILSNIVSKLKVNNSSLEQTFSSLNLLVDTAVCE